VNIHLAFFDEMPHWCIDTSAICDAKTPANACLVSTKLDTVPVHGFPTKTLSIDVLTSEGQPIFPHTVLVFIPGNPGLVDWYVRSFQSILGRLGPGFAARGVSNAGHAFEDDLAAAATDKRSIAHTLDGQSIHKCAYIDLLTEEFDIWRTSKPMRIRPSLPQWIFVCHSIGCHFLQRACMLRPDIICQTKLLIHITPFLRMSAPRRTQRLLDWAASNGQPVISFSTSILNLLKQLPRSLLNEMLKLLIDGQ
jgi:pimeloyl-ACP methyl ester carboxylesterase